MKVFIIGESKKAPGNYLVIARVDDGYDNFTVFVGQIGVNLKRLEAKKEETFKNYIELSTPEGVISSEWGPHGKTVTWDEKSLTKLKAKEYELIKEGTAYQLKKAHMASLKEQF